MKLKHIIRFLDMMNLDADVFVRFGEGSNEYYVPFEDLTLRDFADGIFGSKKEYTLNLKRVVTDESENPKLFVELNEDF